MIVGVVCGCATGPFLCGHPAVVADHRRHMHTPVSVRNEAERRGRLFRPEQEAAQRCVVAGHQVEGVDETAGQVAAQHDHSTFDVRCRPRVGKRGHLFSPLAGPFDRNFSVETVDACHVGCVNDLIPMAVRQHCHHHRVRRSRFRRLQPAWRFRVQPVDVFQHR